MCTQINQEHLITVHHEMGHIEYFIAYQNQPYAFRNGANPGFHEAIGDTISLSVETRSYLKQIGLLDGPDNNDGMHCIFCIVAWSEFECYLKSSMPWDEGSISDLGDTTFQGHFFH